MESAIDSTNAYVPCRLKVASGQLSLRTGGEGGPHVGEAVGCGLIGFLYCSIASLTRFASFGAIFAINKDKNAPIFKQCDFGLVGDIKDVLPAITAAL